MLIQYKSIFYLLILVYNYYIKCSYNSNLNIFKIYNANNAPQHFFKSLVNDN